MAQFLIVLATAVLCVFPCHVLAGPTRRQESGLEARDLAADASKILSVLHASQFCSSFINLHDSTITMTSTGPAQSATVSTVVTVPALTTTTELDLSGSTTTITTTLPAVTTTTELDLSASTTTKITTLAAATATVTSSIPGTTTTVTTTLPGLTSNTRIDITTTSTKPTSFTPTVTQSVYTFNGAAKRGLGESDLTPRSAPPIISQLQGFASSVVSDACSRYVQPHTTTTTASVAGSTLTVTLSSTTQLPEVTSTHTVQLPASTATATITPDVVTATNTVQLPASTATATITPDVVTATSTVQLPVVTATATITPAVVSITTTINLPQITATSTTRLAGTTITQTITHETGVYTTVTLPAVTTTTTLVNAPVCTASSQIKNEADGYGVYYSQKFTAPGVTTLTACCQACYQYPGCQEYVFFYSDSSDTTGSCWVYYGGSQSDHSHPNISSTCPSGVYQQVNNPSTTSPFGGNDYVVGLGQCATFV